MYKCQDCGNIFDAALIYTEQHGLDTPPYEKRSACPNCKGEFLFEAPVRHCRCSGAKLKANAGEYCDDTCRKKDARLRALEVARKNKRASDPLWVMVREVAEYNREHSTRYSYGQYVALIKPRLTKRGCRNDY